jgi:medium-chain acyl-[acyl-carrier-protein] hydrolase
MQIAAAIAADPGPRDFAIFGHSMGAVLGLEVLRTCAMMHLRLPSLFVASGCRWPSQLQKDDLHALPDPEFRDRLRELGGTPPEVLEHDELMAMVSPALRADFALLNSYAYRPGMALPLPVHVFTGTEDSEVGEDHLAGWLKESRQPGTIHRFDGGHFFVHSHETAVLAQLRAVLA